jgi:hypothetical protein
MRAAGDREAVGREMDVRVEEHDAVATANRSAMLASRP